MKAACGHVFKYGDNVDTDVIIPARYLNSSDPKELATHCMEDIDKDFVKNVKEGDIIVANKNFGCGSSREHAPISIKAAGVSCVIAETFARIFYRNAINIGLPIIECPDAAKEIEAGDEVVVLVSGLGATPVMELYVLYDEIDKILQEKGIKTHRAYVGNYFTSLEMSGATLTVMKLDEELKELIDMPAYSMGLKQN